MDTIAAICCKDRFRLNTRTLLDLPCQGLADHTAAPRGVNRRPGSVLDHFCDDDVVIAARTPLMPARALLPPGNSARTGIDFRPL
ncbi:hypothetical protein [Streptomyces sp. NPDC005476]|uniref:hypothetical protein n=1 Tax=Streptomyces sp. NPDC005476 TaxID=3156882 RepID=UPI00345276C8